MENPHFCIVLISHQVAIIPETCYLSLIELIFEQIAAGQLFWKTDWQDKKTFRSSNSPWHFKIKYSNACSKTSGVWRHINPNSKIQYLSTRRLGIHRFRASSFYHFTDILNRLQYIDWLKQHVDIEVCLLSATELEALKSGRAHDLISLHTVEKLNEGLVYVLSLTELMCE